MTTYRCLLLLFYTVESLERERSTRLAAIAFAAPIRTGSLLLGKLVALGVVAMAIVVAVALGGIIAILIQGEVGVSLRPFLLYWGLLLLPTILLWIAFVMAIHSAHTEPICDLRAGPGTALLHGIPALDQPDQLGRQLADVGCGPG